MQATLSITVVIVGNASMNLCVNKVSVYLCLSVSFCISVCGVGTSFLQPPNHYSNGNASLGSTYSGLWWSHLVAV
jgi:hypothetical protein